MKDFFVYGTLKKGRSNHSLMGNSKFLGEAITVDNYVLLTCGFPYMVPEHEHPEAAPVRGEVYKCDEDVVQDLDWLEGHPNHFERLVREVILDGKRVTVWVYMPSKETQDSGILDRFARCPQEDGVYVF